MVYSEREFVLKDGTKVAFKSPDVSDARLLLDHIIKVASSTNNILSTPDDFKKYLDDISLEEKYIASKREGKNCSIAVFYQGVIVGVCSLDFRYHQKDSHRASIGIAIQEEFQNKGIGSLLFDEMINIAKNTEGVEQIELDVINSNAMAKHLYTKKGFVKYGDKPHELKLQDGTYLDGESMVLFLNK